MRILLGVTAGIAAIKAPLLAADLQKNGHEIKIIMTTDAEKIISKNEISKRTGCRIYTHLFPEDYSTNTVLTTHKIPHIELGRWADIILVAPATAHCIARLASGICDDLLTTTVLAAAKPTLMIPSMNTNMWLHPATQHNVQKLKMYGYTFMEPVHGPLACGTEGIGKQPSNQEIIKFIEFFTKRTESMKNYTIIITSGATREYIDTVRFLSNRSSGKMGNAFASECYRRGAHVIHITSRNAAQSPYPIETYWYDTYQELHDILHTTIKDANVVIQTAAITDFTVKKQNGKIKSNQPLSLRMNPQVKLIHLLKKWNPDVLLIGFKAVYALDKQTITSELIEYFEKSYANYIVVNDISRSDIGFEVDQNEGILVSADQEHYHISKTNKNAFAQQILDKIRLPDFRTKKI